MCFLRQFFMVLLMGTGGAYAADDDLNTVPPIAPIDSMRPAIYQQGQVGYWEVGSAPQGELLRDQQHIHRIYHDSTSGIYPSSTNYTDFTWLNSYFVYDEIVDLHLLKQGKFSEIQVWQKLKGYMDEVNTLHKKIFPFFKKQLQYHFSPSHQENKDKQSQHLEIFTDMIGNRLSMCWDILDALLIYRKKNNDGTETLEHLQLLLNKLSEGEDKIVNIERMAFNPSYQQFMTTFQQSKAYQLIQLYNDGIKVNLGYIP